MGAEGGLIERAGELAVLDRVVDDAAGGAGAFVVAEGPPGIGKTRLLEAARELAGARGFATLRARGGELERDFAYGVVRQLFERRLREAGTGERKTLLAGAAEMAQTALGLQAPNGLPTPGADIQFAVTHGLYWLTANLAQPGPLLLEVDDVHWADAPTLRFLAYLVARLEGVPILVVAAARPAEPGPTSTLVEALCTERVATRLQPEPLSLEGVGILVADALGSAPAQAFTESCYESTGGNPYYLRELLDALAADRVEPTVAAAERVRALGPRTVSRSLLMRLAALPGAATLLARAVAVLGARAQLAQAAALAGIPVDAAEEAVDGLVAASILAPIQPLQFVHPILREAIYADLGPAQRARLHADAAKMLEEAGALAGELAPHLLATRPAGDEHVVRLLDRAATEALDQGAPETARRYLRRALDEPPVGDQRIDLLARLADAELRLGSYGESSQLLAEAVELEPDPTRRVELSLIRVYAVLAAEGSDAVLGMLERALEDAGGEDSQLGQLVLAELCGHALLASDEKQSTLRRLERFADGPGDTRAGRRLLSVAALQQLAAGDDAQRCIDMARRALADGELLREESATSLFYFFAITALTFAEGVEEASEAVEAGFADAEARHSVWAVPGLAFVRSLIASPMGDLRAAELDARISEELAIPSTRTAASSALAQALLDQGDLDAAERHLLETGIEELEGDWPDYWLGPFVRGRVRLARGRAADALADFEAVGRRATTVGGVVAGLPWQPYVALAQLALDRADEARATAAQALERARAWGTPSRLGLALRVRGHVETGEERIRWLREAASALEATPARLEHARALHDLGVALARAGQRKEARTILRRAVDAGRACGARGLAESSHQELRVAGARPRALMFSGPDSLTATERRVAEMAASGMANREIAQTLFVTVKTVENHLGRAYGKLGISSRKQLAAALDG